MAFVSGTIATYLPLHGLSVPSHVSAGSLAVAFAVGLVSWLAAAEELDLRRERGLRG